MNKWKELSIKNIEVIEKINWQVYSCFIALSLFFLFFGKYHIALTFAISSFLLGLIVSGLKFHKKVLNYG
jgi:hypothetical protein